MLEALDLPSALLEVVLSMARCASSRAVWRCTRSNKESGYFGSSGGQ